MTDPCSSYPDFDLSRLLRTVFGPMQGERVAVLIDLEDPTLAKDFAFLEDPSLTIQKIAVEQFYRAFQERVLGELELVGGELFAYKITGGSNLELPQEAYDIQGRQVRLQDDVYAKYDILLCISTFSATAPLTASSKVHGFRGATLHGVNSIILSSGLCVDYNKVSQDAEKYRLGMTKAEKVEIDFVVADTETTLTLLLGGQEAQTSNGLCREAPDVANLPAGEVYYVPTGAEGQFPLRYDDGTIGLMEVSRGGIVGGELLQGERKTVEQHLRLMKEDPAVGLIGELGFGTQELPVSGRDIQDEKILGTVHVATGRSDHLGGDITLQQFRDWGNATHEDILFSPTKTPEIQIPQVRIYHNGDMQVLIENFQPSSFMRNLLAS